MPEEKPLRDESTVDNKAAWQNVDDAAKHVPDWIVSRLSARIGEKKTGMSDSAKSDKNKLK